MVHPYLKARSHPEQVQYPSELLKEALKRTHGVPIFQEQVMQIAVLGADFTPGEADALRRSMAAWKRHGHVHVFEERLISGLLRNGYTPEFAQRIFKQIEGFGEYGFPESHAASFAILVYISCWLKWHEPACFLAAMLNSQPLGFYGPSQLVQDAQRHGVTVLPADVSHSDWDCTLENWVSDPDSGPSEECQEKWGSDPESGRPCDRSTQPPTKSGSDPHFGRVPTKQLTVRLGLRQITGLRKEVAQ
jgi:error-prone DNA polymerase